MRIDRSFSLLVAFLFIGIAPGIRAQIPVSVHAEAVDLKSMSHRTLIVEIVDEDERISVDFPKKQAEQMMTDYRADVANYNALMQKAVNQYWKFNTKIEFKHSSEIRKLFESESSKYVALVKGSVTGEGPLWGPTTGVPCLMFQRTDQKSKPAFKGRVLAFNKLDYGIFRSKSTRLNSSHGGISRMPSSA